MEAIAYLIVVFVCCGLVLIPLALIMYGAQLLDEKIDNWLTDRKLRKKFGDNWNQ